MLFARAHHGLFLAGFLFYLFLVKKKMSEKLTYLTFFLMSIFFVFSFYGLTNRSLGKPLAGFIKYFLSNTQDVFINSYVLVMFFFSFFMYLRIIF